MIEQKRKKKDCLTSNLGKIENVKHFICTCTYYSKDRSELFLNINNTVPVCQYDRGWKAEIIYVKRTNLKG